jgi:hypothetical protein
MGYLMKTFVHTLVIMAALALGSVALADTETRIITGRVVEVSNGGIIVQNGKKRLDIVTPYATKYTGKPKVGDTVTVHYNVDTDRGRFSPDGEATKIEVIAGRESKK